jgi:hypothetical protein
MVAVRQTGPEVSKAFWAKLGGIVVGGYEMNNEKWRVKLAQSYRTRE